METVVSETKQQMVKLENGVSKTKTKVAIQNHFKEMEETLDRVKMRCAGMLQIQRREKEMN